MAMEIEVRAFEVVNGEEPWERETRYAIYEKGTDNKLDDAQGWGYKSVKKAYAAWHYKNRSPEEKRKAERLERKIKDWLKRHESFAKWMEDESFYALKDGEKLDCNYVRRLLKMENLEIDFPVRDLIRVWRKF